MSGAEVLFGVGILCNVMQIITFGRDALQVYQHVRDGGAPDPSLDTYLEKATTNYKEMKEQLARSRTLSSDHRQLVNIGEEAYNGLLEFRQNFNKLHVDEASRRGLRGKFRVAKSGFKTLWRSKDLEDLEKTFQRHEQLLQTRLIHRICSQADAADLLSREAFKDVNISIQHVVTKLSEGQTELSALTSQEAVQTKAVVEQQHQATRTAVTEQLSITQNNIQARISDSTSMVQQQISSRAQEAEAEKRHEQLLASLRYPEMNSRRNQVETNYPKTFQWIFSTKRPRTSFDSSSDSSQASGNGYESSLYSVDEADENRNHPDRNETKGYADSDSSCSTDTTLFTSWLRCDSKLFWISGKPASGKSTLMKFIISNPHTMENLGKWKPNVQILTHYFWMAGTMMERSIRGMMLSLLHQVLLERHNLGQRLLGEMPFIRDKWSQQDWSIQELEEVLCWTLQSAESAFCIFLDGLDESVELGKQLWVPNNRSSIFDRILKVKNVKVCASSREEDVFCIYFEGCRRLRVHNLTKRDLRRFAAQRLKGMVFTDPEDRKRLLDHVLDRADGVFLWTALVLDSIIRAFRLGNNIDSLIERVDHTPTDMKQLFEDMWKRSGDDGDIPSYRACTSRYFNLAIVATLDPDQMVHYNDAVSLPNFALASEKDTIDDLLDVNRDISVSQIRERCSQTETEIGIVCHGLLQVRGGGYSDLRWGLPGDLQYCARKEIRFVHRCVIDFLTDTETGITLLDACKWSREETWARLLGSIMIMGRVATAKIPKRSPSVDIVIGNKRYQEREEFDTYLKRIFESMGRVFPIPGSPHQDIIMRRAREWQLAGLFLDRDSWVNPGRCLSSPNQLEHEYLETMASSSRTSIIIDLLAELPYDQLLQSIPAIVRGLSTARVKRRISHIQDREIMITEIILGRLLELREEDVMGLDDETHEFRRYVGRLLFSWFFSALDKNWCFSASKTTRPSITAILDLFNIVLSNEQDWEQLVPLHLHSYRNSWFKLSMSKMTDSQGQLPVWQCYAIVNFATAYKIMSATFNQNTTLWETVSESHPLPSTLDGTRTFIQPLVLRTQPDPEVFNHEEFHAFRPAEQDGIGAILLRSLLTDYDLTEDEQLFVSGLSPMQGPRRIKVADSRREALVYLIETIGDVEGLPIHPWMWTCTIEEQPTREDRRIVPARSRPALA